jgi:hypothetical protein
MTQVTCYILILVALVPQLIYGDTRTIVYDCDIMPNICLNFCWAVYCQGLMLPLHGGLGVNPDQNRKDIGIEDPESAPLKKWRFNTRAPLNADKLAIAKSPDEYPLASSLEGGLAVLNNQPIGPSLRMATIAPVSFPLAGATGPAPIPGPQTNVLKGEQNCTLPE